MADVEHDESRLARAVHQTLFFGVAFSGVLLFAGLVIVLVRGQPRPEGPPLSLGQLLRTALAGSGVSLLDLGVLLLMCTPLARVAVLAVGWMMTGRRRFAAVAIAVLALLGLSLFLGIG